MTQNLRVCKHTVSIAFCTSSLITSSCSQADALMQNRPLSASPPSYSPSKQKWIFWRPPLHQKQIYPIERIDLCSVQRCFFLSDPDSRHGSDFGLPDIFALASLTSPGSRSKVIFGVWNFGIQRRYPSLASNAEGLLWDGLGYATELEQRSLG